MATITSTANGNWSAGGTWVGGVAPGSGDTAVLAHNVTVDVNTTIGTSPNDVTTAVVTVNAAKILTIGVGITLTCKGNQSWVNGAGLVMGAGSQLVFDNSASGGSPTYRVTSSGICTLSAIGTSGSRCGISAISGQGWQFYDTASNYLAFSAITATYCDFTRMRPTLQSGFFIFSGTSTFSRCRFISGGCVWFIGTSTSASCIVEDCEWSGGSYPSNGAVVLQMSGTFSSGSRRFKRNVLDGLVTYVAKGFTIERNVLTGEGFTSAQGAGYTWASFRENFCYATAGDTRITVGDVDRNFFAVNNGVGNPHFLKPSATNSVDVQIKQNVFESQSPNLIDTGDCLLIMANSTSGGYKIIARNNLVLKSAVGSDMSGDFVTIYNTAVSILEVERNTSNVDNHAVGGKRGFIGLSEATNGAAGQVAKLKGNLVYGSSAGQGYIADRVTANVKDIITVAGCDYNWRYNTSDGDNQRGYEDKAASNTLWTAGDAVAAGVDVNQGSGDPAFFAGTRNSLSWVAARGYGSTFADVLVAVKADTSRIIDLINYIFEGYKPTTSGCRTAAADGACVGAANWHDTTRSLTVANSLYEEINTNWLT